jgi:nitronate monooxygenase
MEREERGMSNPRAAFCERFGLELPVIQAPMIGPKPALASAVSAAGGLGSIACAALTPDGVRAEVERLRAQTDRPFALNFFAHTRPDPDLERDAAWMRRLAPYYAEFGLDPDAVAPGPERAPFDAAMAAVVRALRPPVVSFHFGLPEADLLAEVRAAGCRILGCATTVAEARWLAARGVDAIVAQGFEAGGHRGLFLSADIGRQVGTIALVPQVVDAVNVPVIAAGGIADTRGVAAAFALGAAAVQVGTAYLFCAEAGLSVVHRTALSESSDSDTALTTVFTGRPARGVSNRAMRELGPISLDAPAFPRAAAALQPLRAAAEAQGSGAFSPLWSGQAAALAKPCTAAELTRTLASGAERLR